MPITKIAASGFSDAVNFRNIIINGDMSIAQRSTSVSSLTSSNTYKTIDRYATELGSNGTWTQSQSTDVPTGQGFGKSLKMDCTSTGSGGYLHITQRFEGQNLIYLNKGRSTAESLTLSFWVKSAKTGTYIAEFRDTDNTRNISKSYTISSADTWEKKTITYPGDTSGGLSNDNGASLELNLWLAAGSSNTSGTLQTDWASQVSANRAVGQVNLGDSTSNDWYITGLQLEAGTTASEFEFLPVDVNTQRCQRYYLKFDRTSSTSTLLLIGGFESSSAAGVGGLAMPVPMRATPTLSFETGARIYSDGLGGSTFSIGQNRCTNLVAACKADVSGTAVAGKAAYIYLSGDATPSNMELDAEL